VTVDAQPAVTGGARPTDGREALLRVRELTVTYGTPTPAVDKLDFEVGEREAVALLGVNGAGKSSTLNAISNLVAHSGDVIFDGQSITRTPPEKIARAGIIHVPEGRRLFSALTAEENLLIGMTAKGRRAPIFTLDDIYDLFPQLKVLRKRGGWQLSGGEQQMVAIGRGLLASPRVLLLDEPSLGLAPKVVSNVLELIKGLRDEAGLTIVLVEQNARSALAIDDTGIVLNLGAVVASAPAAALAADDALRRHYLGF